MVSTTNGIKLSGSMSVSIRPMKVVAAAQCRSHIPKSMVAYIYIIPKMRTDGKRALAPFKPLVQHEARALKLLFRLVGHLSQMCMASTYIEAILRPHLY